MTTEKNSITFLNLTHPANDVYVQKLRLKLGDSVENINLFAYQNGVEPLIYKYHEKQRKLFISYPSFNLLSTQHTLFVYLKRIGEKFPSKCYKIKKSDVSLKLISDEVNAYINQTVDVQKCLNDTLSNETLVVLDNLKIGVLIKAIEKEKKKDETDNGPITYARLYDMIEFKFNEVMDSGYLELLNKACIMIWETWNNPASVNFEFHTLSKKEIKENEKKIESETIEPIIKEPKAKKIPIPEFNKPKTTPELENVYEIESE